jgi:thioredoxin reductase (NADPH)
MEDVIIIGGGPAGLTAAIYAARYNLKTLVFAKALGGVIVNSNDVGNWPGIQRISGLDLMNNLRDHAESLGVTIIEDEVTDVKKVKDHFVATSGEKEYESLAVLLALGSHWRELNVPGEKTFFGRGVHYCATCDAAFYKNKIAAVVGGGDSAALGTQEVAEHAAKVYLIHRRNEFRAEPYRVDMLKKNPKVEFVLSAQVKEIRGEKKVTSVLLDTGREIKLDGVFVEVGSDPVNALAKLLGCDLDENGLVKVKVNQQTSVPGVWCAGDLSDASNRFRQALTAASEGSIAAENMYHYVTQKKMGR